MLKKAKSSLYLTCSSAALLLLALSPATASAQGFQSCTDVKDSGKCKSLGPNSDTFKTCCAPEAEKPVEGAFKSANGSPNSPPVAGTGNLSSEMACFEAVKGISRGDGVLVDVGGKDTLLVPATFNGARGFYLFTAGSAYFQAFPAKPQDSNDQFNHYYFKMQLPGQKPVYLTYSADKKDRGTSAIAQASGPHAADKNKYQKIENNDALDRQSRAVLSQELQNRVKSTSPVYQDNFSTARELARMYAPYGNIPELRTVQEFQKLGKDATSKSLNACILKEDKNLRAAVADEQAKLARVNPTIGGSDQPSSGVKATGVH
ncbi:MAG: hypothetical protein H7222_07260 [Methylotenera sp.]|nr:hypothetical protein [Oligoflexia bacterium]